MATAVESVPARRPRRPRTPSEYFQPAIFLIGGALVPSVIQPVLGDRWLPIITIVYCAIYVMFALGLNIVVGYAGLLDLGYVAFFLFGAYTAAWLMSDFFYQIDPGFHLGDAGAGKLPGINLSFWIILPIAGVFCAIWGVIIGAPTLRLKSDYLALVTLGFGEIIPQATRNAESIKGFNLTNGTKGIAPINSLDMGWLSWSGLVKSKVGVFDYTTRYYIIFILCVLFVIVSLRLRDGKLGRAWLAIREDELAASLMGVPLMRTKLWAYAVGAAAGGFGGAFYCVSLGGVNVDTFNFQFSVLVLCMVIVGGMGNVYGVMLGAILLTWVNYTGMTVVGDEFNSLFGTTIAFPQYQFLFFGVVLVMMMLFRRDGILPAARQKQVKQLDRQLEKIGTEGASA